MDRKFLLVTGTILLTAGICDTAFWVTARKEFHSLARTGGAQGGLREDSAAGRALRILGVDLSEPPGGMPAASPGELARKISRGVHAHLAIGVLLTIAGLALLSRGIMSPAEGHGP